VFNILLQVLDDGRMTDNKGRTADFRNCIIIMTSNIGSMLIHENLKGINPVNRQAVLEKTREEVFDMLRKSIRPEFLNRIDEILMFAPLTESEIESIVRLQLKGITNLLITNDIHLKVSDDAIKKIAGMGYDPQFGARPLKRVLQREILNRISKMILSGEIRKDTEIQIGIANNMLTFNIL
jgi:ATP-dependent Clp protease ATP-binding subunit ClpB